MLLDDGQELERHAAGFLGARLPLLYWGFAGIQIPGEDGLAHLLALANLLNLAWLDGSWNSQARLIELTHGGLVDGTYA